MHFWILLILLTSSRFDVARRVRICRQEKFEIYGDFARLDDAFAKGFDLDVTFYWEGAEALSYISYRNFGKSGV